MKKVKVILTAPMVTKKGSIDVGKEFSLPVDEAYSFYKNGTVQMSKKDIERAETELKKSLEEKEKKQKEIELLLQKDELEAEKTTLESRLAEITGILEIGTK